MRPQVRETSISDAAIIHAAACKRAGDALVKLERITVYAPSVFGGRADMSYVFDRLGISMQHDSHLTRADLQPGTIATFRVSPFWTRDARNGRPIPHYYNPDALLALYDGRAFAAFDDRVCIVPLRLDVLQTCYAQHERNGVFKQAELFRVKHEMERAAGRIAKASGDVYEPTRWDIERYGYVQPRAISTGTPSIQALLLLGAIWRDQTAEAA